MGHIHMLFISVGLSLSFDELAFVEPVKTAGPILIGEILGFNTPVVFFEDNGRVWPTSAPVGYDNNTGAREGCLPSVTI
jgi:hypothetical protein